MLHGEKKKRKGGKKKEELRRRDRQTDALSILPRMAARMQYDKMGKKRFVGF
jgi:hypothetical protein